MARPRRRRLAGSRTSRESRGERGRWRGAAPYRRKAHETRRAGRRRVAAVGVGAVGVAADVRVGVAAVPTVRATTVVLFVWRRVGIAELTADLRIHAAAGRWDLSTV